MWLYIQEFINTSFIYYNGGLIFYRKEVIQGDIHLLVKMIYIVSFGQYIVSEESYKLRKEMTLKVLISSYKKIIDEFNIISKK